MRVDLRSLGVTPADEKRAERTTKAHDAEPPASEAASLDQARFSFDHARVKALTHEAMAQPEVRQQKVELLRQAIGKGEYAVNDGQIADAIIADLAAGSAGQKQE